MKILRVFPRRTNATPDDEGVIIDRQPNLFDEADEVHISVTWTYDLPRAEQLAEQWRHVAPVKLGGPATGMRGEEFTPGLYVKRGYTITSRGCPNHCWFCSVWKREGAIRELPVTDGWNLLDDNILACSEAHIRAVFAMLERQPQAPQFTGGLEAARLKPWQAEALRTLRPKQLFFAYDTPDDLEPLQMACQLLFQAGFTRASHTIRAYVLCGYPQDSIEAAEKRMHQTMEAGAIPMAMLWRDDPGNRDPLWMRWQRQWARPAIICHT